MKSQTTTSEPAHLFNNYELRTYLELLHRYADKLPMTAFEMTLFRNLHRKFA